MLHAPDFSEEEIRQALSSAYQVNSNEYTARATSWKDTKDEKDTATLSGEELRMRTPFLPENITDGLPPLFADALRFYTDPHERNMASLAACPTGSVLPISTPSPRL